MAYHDADAVSPRPPSGTNNLLQRIDNLTVEVDRLEGKVTEIDGGVPVPIQEKSSTSTGSSPHTAQGSSVSTKVSIAYGRVAELESRVRGLVERLQDVNL